MVEIKVDGCNSRLATSGKDDDIVADMLVAVRCMYESLKRKDPIKAKSFVLAIPFAIMEPNAIKESVVVDLSHLGGKNRENN